MAVTTTSGPRQDEYNLDDHEASDDSIIIVDFDGPHDPDNAVNWSPSRKWLNVFVLASMTFISCVSMPSLNFFSNYVNSKTD